MIRCPVCKAQNEKGPQCRRCRADLSLLFAVEEQRGRFMTLAWRWISEGQGKAVVALANQLDLLKQDGEGNRIRAVGYLLQRDFAKAWEAYQTTISSQVADRDGP